MSTLLKLADISDRFTFHSKWRWIDGLQIIRADGVKQRINKAAEYNQDRPEWLKAWKLDMLDYLTVWGGIPAAVRLSLTNYTNPGAVFVSNEKGWEIDSGMDPISIHAIGRGDTLLEAWLDALDKAP